MFRGLKLIIPKKLRSEMLDIIHSSHLGIVNANQEHVKGYFGHLCTVTLRKKSPNVQFVL